jgi:two-component system CheB/CheR fusion protein
LDVETAPPSADGIVVGVGASAGGLEAFSQLLQALPEDPGFAMVFVQHLAPTHDSALPELLAARTNMPVVQAAEGMRVEPDHVYVIPPNIQMIIGDGRLHLTPRPSDRSQYTPIDHFLASLAESLQDRAIAVILSGTASDGAIGVRETKAVGGITIAQAPDSAKYDGMPRAAVATGMVDLVLRPEEIARELVAIARHPLHRPSPMAFASAVADARDGHLEQVFRMLRASSGVDFRHYKRPTILRRLQRRLVLHKIQKLQDYVKLMREKPAEVRLLYQDILIHVTRFFRDPDSYTALNAVVVPRLLADRQEDQAVRVWVPGCSTGEEAYSITIALLEQMGDGAASAPLQVFATDISEAAIDHARGGHYPASIAADVSPERLRRFFTRMDGGYRVNRQVRDVCIFARQDLIRDPPFSRLDLIVCRNVLIYMSAELQARLMAVFHYALKPAGFLMLGNAETVGIRSDLFSVADKRHRIYDKKLGATDQHSPFEHVPAVTPASRLPVVKRVSEELKSVQGEVNRLLQEQYAPPGIVVDSEFNIVQFRGQTGMFLAPAPGEPNLNVFKMARDGLLHALQGALQEARRTHSPVHRKRLRVRTDGDWHGFDLEIIPITVGERPHYVVLFEGAVQRRHREGHAPDGPAPAVEKQASGRRARQRLGHLEQELATSREYLQSIIQELEAANEELQSANEEVLSANEELQSTNEELDTAKEELQSTNEELNTLNEELHGRNDELSRLNSDLVNLLGSVQIVIVIVSRDLRIRRFTPMAERVLNLLPGDVGRPIGHLRPNIECPDLEEHILQAIDAVTPVEQVVRDRQGGSYVLRIRPYKDLENRIDGAVLALFDLDEASHDQAVRQIRDVGRAIGESLPSPLALVDHELRVLTMNQPFADLVGMSTANGAGKLVYEIGVPGRRLTDLRVPLESLLRGADTLDRVEVHSNGGPRDSSPLIVSARRIESAGKGGTLISIAVAAAPAPAPARTPGTPR